MRTLLGTRSGDELLERQIGQPAQAAYAWLFAARGRTEEARANIDWVPADGFARLAEDMNRPRALCELAQASPLLEYPDHGAAIYEQLAPYADRNVINMQAAVGNGAASHHLALLAALTGDDERAAAHLERALDRNQRIRARP